MTPANLITALREILDPTEIGSYTYPDGRTREAIAVSKPPNGITVDGLEYIIPNFPTFPKSCRSPYFTHRQEKWTIAIVNHNGDDDKGILFTVVDKLSRSLSYLGSSGQEIPVGDPTKSLQQYIFSFYHSEGFTNLNYN